MSALNILYAGFGGQGILFSGKFLAYEGLIAGKHVSWLPSYGPEMRGGTANCSVIISDEEVGSPIVDKPDVLVVMNLPSLDKYENEVVPGGKIFVDSTLIERKVERTDVEVFYVPATGMAAEKKIPTLANMIITGKMLKEIGIDLDNIDVVLGKIVSARHQDLLEVNKDAIKTGYDL
ncbi:MAG: 2-oxoacid:acceptor oxidoreductase family protein [Oscillospiraceae bacterium]|nr:2-oxoacid:acceptor oxidoreductase family protein [Candidatus Limimonas egerieequi]